MIRSELQEAGINAKVEQAIAFLAKETEVLVIDGTPPDSADARWFRSHAIVDQAQTAKHLLGHLLRVARHANTLTWHEASAAVMLELRDDLRGLAVDTMALTVVELETSAAAVVKAVLKERYRQDGLHGAANLHNGWNDWVAILAEEMGEAAWATSNFGEELVQVAAVAVAIDEAIEVELESDG